MTWERTPDGSGYYCLECGFVTEDKDPREIGLHRLEHLAELLADIDQPLASDAVVVGAAERLLREDLPRAREVAYHGREPD